jgi:alpha-L-fucosidase
MFDTRQTDYRITHSSTPFSTHPKANITKEIFEAFRKKGFMTGAYFSKPDWHTPDYWWKYFPPKDRNVTYDPAKYPERWQAFKDFTYRQIEELATGYGRVDILWLDGGWVRPKETINPAVDWQRTIPYSQDIDMARIVAMARRHQPGMLVVDRTVAGEFENYTTPEQTVPKNYLPYPWESCVTLANAWGYVPGDTYKSARTVIHMLTNIVSRNGSLLLNIGPSPEGEWDPKAYDRLREIGAWMKVNEEAIYDTEADPELQGKTNWVFTKKGSAIYAIYQLPEGISALPDSITIPLDLKANPVQVTLLGTRAKIKATRGEDGLHLTWKKGTAAPGEHAWVFKLTQLQ